MGLETVVTEILNQAQAEEKKILAEAEREKQRILDAAEGEADALRAKYLADTRAKVEALRRERISAAEFEARRRVLTTQRELTDEFRAKVMDALSKLPRNEREKIHERLLKKATKEVSKGRIHARKDDLPFLTKTSGLAAGRELAGAGGFQVESEDGTVVHDYRFETYLENAWKDLQSTIRTVFQG